MGNQDYANCAKLIQNDIKSLIQQKDVYPKYKEMSSAEETCSFLLDSLYIFLQGLFKNVDAKMMIATIGQAILQVARPCVILAPHQLGLGVQLHHHFASKYLIDTLHTHGLAAAISRSPHMQLSPVGQKFLISH